MRVSLAGVIAADSATRFAWAFAGFVFLATVIAAAAICIALRPRGGHRGTPFTIWSRDAYLRARDRSRTGNSPSGGTGGDTPPGGNT